MTGMVIGAVQTYDYFEMIQDRIFKLCVRTQSDLL